jgi:hypothetical protein
MAFAYFVVLPQIKKTETPAVTPARLTIFWANTSVVNGPMIDNQFGPPPNYYTNVTQGNDLKINVTITSTEPQDLVYVKNIQVFWYNPEVNLLTWSGQSNISNETQTSAFSYSSSPNPVSLHPSMSNSTILTLHIEKNAPTGQYSMYINLEAQPKQTNENSGFMELDESYLFAMIINPS